MMNTSIKSHIKLNLLLYIMVLYLRSATAHRINLINQYFSFGEGKHSTNHHAPSPYPPPPPPHVIICTSFISKDCTVFIVLQCH